MQGRVEIADQIPGVLEADRQAQQVFRHRRRRALSAPTVLDEALDAAERRGPLEHLHCGGDGHGFLLAASHANREHPAEPTGHLAGGDVMAGIRPQPRIEDGGQRWVPVEVAGEGQGTLGRAAHP